MLKIYIIKLFKFSLNNMSNVNVELERTVWSYKNVEDSELSNKNLEIILNFYDKNKFELNINKFSSSFNIDLETFLDNTGDNAPLSDDVFSSSKQYLNKKRLSS